METPILKQIAQLLQDRREHRRRLAVFVCLAVIVGFGTVAALRLIGQTLTHKERVLVCSLNLHEHISECYNEEGKLICGYADYVVHEHNDDCYNAEGERVCTLPEIEVHEHTDECYEEQKTLVCGLEESAGHEHLPECYTRQQGELTCQIPEHQHAEGCYDAAGAAVCGTEEHQHTDECYAWNEELACQDVGHTHTDECYKTEKVKICEKPEVRLHVHTEECYEKIEDVDEDSKKVGDNEADEDSEENYRLICGQLQVEEHIHAEEFNCFKVIEVNDTKEEGSETQDEPGDDSKKDEIFTTDLNEEEKGELEKTEEINDTKGSEETEGSENSDESENKDENEDSDVVTDSEQKETENDKKAYERIKSYKGEGYTVKVAYNEDAEIPDDAELIADQITAESDEKHYAKREAEFQEMMEGGDSTMSALFKIGFYVNGEEIEPKTPVAVTVQFLDSNGLPEGAPITVIHFAKEGNEVLDGSDVEEGSTTFEMESFSEIAIGAGPKKTKVKKDGSLYISEDYEYNHDAFHITFHIEGNAAPVGTKRHLKDEGEEQSAPSDNEREKQNVPVEDEVTEWNRKQSPAGDIELSSEGLIFNVGPMDENSEEYKAIEEYTEGLSEASEIFLVQALSYSLTCEGVELDLSNCEVTAEITPTEALIEQAEGMIPTVVPELEGSEEERSLASVLSVVEATEGEVKELGIMGLDENVEQENIDVGLQGYNAVIYGSQAANPLFKVQYYANLDVIAQSGVGSIDVIDTDNGGTGNGGKLPKNNSIGVGSAAGNDRNILSNAAQKSIYLEETEGTIDAGNGHTANKLYKVATESVLKEVYTKKDYHYIEAPNLLYFNRLNDNKNYKLKEIWVLKEGKEESSTDEADWEIHTLEISAEDDGQDDRPIETICKEHNHDSAQSHNLKLHFTNKPESESKSDTDEFILIKDNTVIRLVYDTTFDTVSNNTVFYDYDISDGNTYKSYDTKGEKLERDTVTDDTKAYMYTDKQGINSNNNILAFGNNNTCTGMGTTTWEKDGYKNSLNMTNFNGYKGCTFGLTEHLNVDGTISYSPGINAPNLFNENGSANGKTTYNDGSLSFSRRGDTYTMTAARVDDYAINGLDLFNNPAQYAIWTNNFWPMDQVASAGTEGHDLMFGDSKAKDNKKSFGSQKPNGEGTPLADDYRNHNAYFGMYYTVDFELTEDYAGPLEYLFYGDDDMWVFLSKTTETTNEDGTRTTTLDGQGTLICDIGGVHSSVGEYVNLWDWIRKGEKGTYRLSFFYTERGASGSSCWMQFTLPSVSFNTPVQSTGALQVSKNVTQGTSDDEFGFKIKFKDKWGNQLKDDYPYARYSPDPNRCKTDVLIWDGGNFQLKAGEHIIIDYLPLGATYEITEIGPVRYDEESGKYVPLESETKYLATATGPSNMTNTPVEGDESTNKRVVEGMIGEVTKYAVTYNNEMLFELPETGGSGSTIYTIAGILCVMFGAGFMYRKKVRERRGQVSSGN